VERLSRSAEGRVRENKAVDAKHRVHGLEHGTLQKQYDPADHRVYGKVEHRCSRRRTCQWVKSTLLGNTRLWQSRFPRCKRARYGRRCCKYFCRWRRKYVWLELCSWCEASCRSLWYWMLNIRHATHRSLQHIFCIIEGISRVRGQDNRKNERNRNLGYCWVEKASKDFSRRRINDLDKSKCREFYSDGS